LSSDELSEVGHVLGNVSVDIFFEGMFEGKCPGRGNAHEDHSQGAVQVGGRGRGAAPPAKIVPLWPPNEVYDKA